MAARGRRKKGEPPPYLRHSSGQAYVFYNGEKVYLGAHGTPESLERYEGIVRQWRAAQKDALDSVPLIVPKGECTLPELVDYAISVARRRYRIEDRVTPEATDVARALQAVLEVGGSKPARLFTARDLKQVRQVWIERGMGRKGVNQHTGRVRRAFRWAVAEDMIPVSVLTTLEAVEDLRESEFHEPDPPEVTDAPWEMVEQVLPFLNRQLQTMILLQWHMGMRPGEVCRMKTGEIAQDGRVEWRGKWLSSLNGAWVFQPSRHKNRRRGKFLAYVLSPTAQKILEPWLRADPEEFLFQPREADAERRAQMRQKRKTPVQPSQQYRRKSTPLRQPGDFFQITSYIHAVHKACARAFPPPLPLGRAEGESLRAWQQRLTREQKAEIKAWEEWHRFSPNQLRHAFCTRIERAFGITDAAKAVGHARIATTEVYVARDLERASEIAAQLG